MSTTAILEPVTVTRLDRDKWDQHGEMADGESIASSALGFTDDQFRPLPDDHPGIIAWERVVDEAIVEIGPQVRDLLCQALERRLPWTWEPDNGAVSNPA
jgi:hypothetical protein